MAGRLIFAARVVASTGAGTAREQPRGKEKTVDETQSRGGGQPAAAPQGAAQSGALAAVYIDEIEPGMSRTRQKTLSLTDIEMFGQVSGDMNPIHFDEAYASSTPFKGRIAHGMLTASLLSGVIGQELPGQGTIYLKQDLKFLAPVRPGDTVETTVTVAEVNRERRRVTLDCVCRVAGTVVLEGQALVLAPQREG